MSDDFLGYRRGPDEPSWVDERTDEWEALHPSLRYPGDTGRDQLPRDEPDDLAPRRTGTTGRGAASVPPRSGAGVYPASARPADLPVAKPVSDADRGLPVPPPSGGGIRWSPPPAPGRRPPAARGRGEPDRGAPRGHTEQDPRYGPGRNDDRWPPEGRDGWGQDARPVSPARDDMGGAQVPGGGRGVAPGPARGGAPVPGGTRGGPGPADHGRQRGGPGAPGPGARGGPGVSGPAASGPGVSGPGVSGPGGPRGGPGPGGQRGGPGSASGSGGPRGGGRDERWADGDRRPAATGPGGPDDRWGEPGRGRADERWPGGPGRDTDGRWAEPGPGRGATDERWVGPGRGAPDERRTEPGGATGERWTGAAAARGAVDGRSGAGPGGRGGPDERRPGPEGWANEPAGPRDGRASVDAGGGWAGPGAAGDRRGGTRDEAWAARDGRPDERFDTAGGRPGRDGAAASGRATPPGRGQATGPGRGHGPDPSRGQAAAPRRGQGADSSHGQGRDRGPGPGVPPVAASAQAPRVAEPVRGAEPPLIESSRPAVAPFPEPAGPLRWVPPPGGDGQPPGPDRPPADRGAPPHGEQQPAAGRGGPPPAMPGTGREPAADDAGWFTPSAATPTSPTPPATESTGKVSMDRSEVVSAPPVSPAGPVSPAPVSAVPISPAAALASPVSAPPASGEAPGRPGPEATARLGPPATGEATGRLRSPSAGEGTGRVEAPTSGDVPSGPAGGEGTGRVGPTGDADSAWGGTDPDARIDATEAAASEPGAGKADPEPEAGGDPVDGQVAEASPDTVLPAPAGPAAGAATALRAPTMLAPIVPLDGGAKREGGGRTPTQGGEGPADTAEPADSAPDPEQVLASYEWRFHHETLRELVENPEELREIRDRLSEKLEPATDNRARARLLSLRAVVSRILGDLGKALSDGKLALAHAEATGELRRIAIAQARLAHVLQWRGDFAEADRLFEEANSSELPDRLRATMHEHAGRSSYDQGRYMEACNHFERALELRKVEDPDLIARTELALDAVFNKVAENGWGPYPRAKEEILQIHRPPAPAFHDRMQRWGYTNAEGEFAVPPEYADVQPFRDEVAWVRRPEAQTWELIDEQGQQLITASAGYLGVGSFSDGLAWVSRDGNGSWIAIDKSGRIVIAEGFDDVRPFRRGIAAVRKGGWGAVDKTGKVVLPTRFSGFATALTDGRYVDGFTDEGLAIVDGGGRKGVVDKAGRLIVPPVHPAVVIHPVAFLIGNGKGQWGALDRRGEPLIDAVHPSRADVMDEIDRLLADTKPVL